MVNCDGLRNKLPHLESLVHTHHPDIIIGTESQLKSSIFTSEITPSGFVTYRKGRVQGNKGGVFIIVKDDAIATECNLIKTDSELLLIEIHIQGQKLLIVGSFYRPSESPAINIEHLASSLSDIQTKFRNAVTVVACYINLGDIDWVKPYARESAKCASFLDLCNEFFLDQLVTEPTRMSEGTKNILDLVLTTHPNFIEWCKVVPGLSDYEAVTFSLNFKPKVNKEVPKKVFMFGKADMSSMKSDMEDFQQSFLSDDPICREQLQQIGKCSQLNFMRIWKNTFHL